MPTAFGMTALRQARYWCERFAYSGGPLSVPSGLSTVFSVAAWNQGRNEVLQAEIDGIAVTRHSALQLRVIADPHDTLNGGEPVDSMALPVGLEWHPLRATAHDTLHLQLTNTSAAAIADLSINYTVTVRRLTAADKLLHQHVGLRGVPLTAEEEQALKQLDLAREVNGRLIVDKTGLQQLQELVRKGTSPISLERMLSGLYHNRETREPPIGRYPTVTSDDQVLWLFRADINPSNPTQGRFLVLSEIAVPSPPALADDVWIRVDRDGDLGVVELRASQLTVPAPVRIVATDYLRIRVQRVAVGAAVQVPIRIRLHELVLSDVVAVQLGLVRHPAQLEHPANYWKTIAGLV